MFRQNSPLSIHQVTNGWIVTQADVNGGVRLEMVFQTMIGLNAFLSSHFSHRESQVLTDG